MHNELQEVMGQSFGVPDDIDETELMGELDALEDELAMEAEHPEAGGVPSYLQVRLGSLFSFSTMFSLWGCCMGSLQSSSMQSHASCLSPPQARFALLVFWPEWQFACFGARNRTFQRHRTHNMRSPLRREWGTTSLGYRLCRRGHDQ